PSLAEVAHHVGLSASHFQRIFKQTLGVSPKDYADAHRQQRLKSALQNGSDVTGALYEAGYGSSSRLYEQSDRILGMTPTAYKEAGQGQEIHYAVGQCPLGWLLLAATSKGICAVRLGDSQARLVQELYQEFSQAHILESGSFVAEWIQLLIDYLAERLPWPELPVDVQATAFQRRVWNELRTIPAGETKTYSDIAAALGQPQATRAVARACAANPVALVVPCHRIVPKAGGSGGYRWGPERKQWLLALEARTAPAPR
ncbi:MAG TPA: methylated-DNA--[protein]-cysteine S-methyltransferase, partial [Anaerolineae bacterium]|nr:methylated-DNA--[protein]-cysteine S-methyltransferase [Anaerolineae bacterium]